MALYGRKSYDRIHSLPSPLRNIFLITAICSLLFHVDIFFFQVELILFGDNFQQERNAN